MCVCAASGHKFISVRAGVQVGQLLTSTLYEDAVDHLTVGRVEP